MKRVLTGFGLALLAAGCASASGGDRGVNRVASQLALEPPPIYALLGFRSELDLSSEQVTALDSIAQEVQQEHGPLIRELRDGSRERPRQPGLLDITSETTDLFEEIRVLQRNAAASVQQVLTEEQEESVCRLFDRSGDRGGRGGVGAPPARRRQGAPTLQPTRAISPWPWCQPETSSDG